MGLRLAGVLRNLGSLFTLLLLVERGHLAIVLGAGLTLAGSGNHLLVLGRDLTLVFKVRGDCLNWLYTLTEVGAIIPLTSPVHSLMRPAMLTTHELKD